MRLTYRHHLMKLKVRRSRLRGSGVVPKRSRLRVKGPGRHHANGTKPARFVSESKGLDLMAAISWHGA
jgi:hypothetical protein